MSEPEATLDTLPVPVESSGDDKEQAPVVKEAPQEQSPAAPTEEPNEASPNGVLEKAREQSLIDDSIDRGGEDEAFEMQINGEEGIVLVEMDQGQAPSDNAATIDSKDPNEASQEDVTEAKNAQEKASTEDAGAEAAKQEPEPVQTDVDVPAESAPFENQAKGEQTIGVSKADEANPDDAPAAPATANEMTLRDQELKMVGGEVIFPRNSSPNLAGWDNLRWMAFNGVRKAVNCFPLYRRTRTRKTLFWGGEDFESRKLVLYDEPQLILLVRSSKDVAELAQLLDEEPNKVSRDDLRQYCVVESVIDPNTSKLRLSPLTTVTSIDTDVADDNFRYRSCFHLMTPTESIALSAVQLRNGAERALTSFVDSGAYLETSKPEIAIQRQICRAHSLDQSIAHGSSDLSWKHQVILGTLHSYVVSGNQKGLEAAISAAIAKQKKLAQSSKISQEELGSLEYLDPKLVDAVDEKGYTPLHYACSSRNSKAVTSLVKVGANTHLKIGVYDRSPAHLSALHLDSASLDAILSVNRRPNVLDNQGRTPTFLAITEGKTVGHRKDPAALHECLSVLESHDGKIFEGPSSDKHPISHLAASWQPEELSVLLNHVQFRYPLPMADLEDGKSIGISVSALYQYPVHQTLIVLRRMIKSSKPVTPSDLMQCQKEMERTLEILFKSGFEPNERIEGLASRYYGDSELVAHVGFAPIQILLAAVLDIGGMGEKAGSELKARFMSLISTAVEVVVKFGGKHMEAPPTVRPAARDELPCSLSKELNLESPDRDTFHVDRSLLKIQSMKQLEEIFVDKVLDSAAVWDSCKATESVGKAIIHQDSKSPIENSKAPGGSDEKSCCICWKAFGALINRKHRCRVTKRHICDECSSKRIIEAGTEYRVTDGQFSLARADQAVAASKPIQRQLEQQQHQQAQQTSSRSMARTSSTRSSVSASSTDARLAKLEAENESQRDSLFGGVMENMAKAVFGAENENQTDDVVGEVGGLAAKLGQTRDALNQRGEKLNTLAEKSDKLVSASQDFASMAKELNRKTQNQGLFW